MLNVLQERLQHFRFLYLDLSIVIHTYLTFTLIAIAIYCMINILSCNNYNKNKDKAISCIQILMKSSGNVDSGTSNTLEFQRDFDLPKIKGQNHIDSLIVKQATMFITLFFCSLY